MANIYRLIILFVFLFPQFAIAGFPMSIVYFTTWYPESKFSSPESACSAAYSRASSENSTYKYIFEGVDGSPGQYGCYGHIEYNGQNYGSSTVGVVEEGPACPSNSTASGSICNCDSGYVENGNSCVPQQDAPDPVCGPLKGMPLGVNFSGASYGAGSLADYGDKVGTPGKACFPGGCEIEGNRSTCGSAAGQITCVLDNPRFNGKSCQEKEAPEPDNPKESACEAGKCEASINGVKMCLPCGENVSKTSNTSTKEKLNPNGGSTKTTTTTTTSSAKPVFDSSPGSGGDGSGSGVPRTEGWKEGGNGAGPGGLPIPAPSGIGWDPDLPVDTKRETQKEATKNADGSAGPVKVTERTTSSQVGADGRVRTATETRTWYEDAAGNRTSDKTTEEYNEDNRDKKSFCDENRDLPMCQKSNFSGACGVDFRCEGDAIQCAVAKEQHIRNCKLFDVKTAESELYESEKNKEGDQTKELPGNETIDMNNRIKTDDLLGGGGGITDVNITVWNRSITLPFSQLNSTLQYLGNILVAVAMLSAVRIVGGK